MIKLLVAGGRDFDDYELLEEELSAYTIMRGREGVLIIQGGAKGADLIAKVFAIANEVEHKTVRAKWEMYGKTAGFIRNEEMWKMCDEGIIFWDGESKGTAHSIELSKKYKKPLRIVYYDYS